MTGRDSRSDGMVCIVCYMYRGQGERAALPLVEGERPEGEKGPWHGPDGRRWKLLMRTWPVVESCETFRPRGPPWQTMTISFRRLFGRLTRSFDFFDFPMLLKTRRACLAKKQPRRFEAENGYNPFIKHAECSIFYSRVCLGPGQGHERSIANGPRGCPSHACLISGIATFVSLPPSSPRRATSRHSWLHSPSGGDTGSPSITTNPR